MLWLSLLALLPVVNAEVPQELPDPTRPYAKRERSAVGSRPVNSPESSLKLQSTLVAPDRRLAMINGKSYRVGERVGDAVVVEIQPHLIVVLRSGVRQVVQLLPQTQSMHRYVSERRNNE